MYSLAHHFMALLGQICAKGFITETDKEILFIIAEKKLKWSKEQVENLLVIQLHPDSSQEYKIEDAIKLIEDAGEILEITKNEIDSIKECVTEALTVSNKNPLAIEKIITPDLIEKIKGYKIIPEPLKGLNWFVDQRWHSLIKDFTPMERKMFEDCLPGELETSTFENLVINYFVSDKFTLNYYGVGIAKLNQIISDVAAIVDFSDKLLNCDSELERAIVLFEIKSASDLNWLKAYYTINKELPFFWLLRNFILASFTDRKGQIYLNVISHSPLKIKEIAEAYDRDEERIRQILQEIESDLDLVLNHYFGVIERMGKLEELKNTCKKYLDNFTTSINKVNLEQNVDLTEDFFNIFLGTLLEEEYLLVGTRRIVIQKLFDGPIYQTGHRWQKMYLIPKTSKKESVEDVVLYLDIVCSEHFKENVIIPDSIQNKFDVDILSLINKEGASWEVRRKLNGRMRHNYTKTLFEIDGDYKLTWLEKVENLYETELRILRKIFYELEKDCPIEGTEIEKKYFTEPMLDPSFKLDSTKISRYSEILNIVNIANKWMTEDYALENFHPDILKVKKANFRDAIYYHLLKEPGLAGKTRSEWAQILNELLKHNYQSNNLQAISKDSRFELTRTVINGNSAHLIYLKE